MLPNDAISIHTNRVSLRWLAEADIQPLFAIFSDPAVTRFWSSPPWTDLGQARQMLAESLADYRAKSAYRFAIERNDDQQLLGTCSLFHIHWQSRRAEIGYALGRPYWGLGYMQEALRALVDYTFRTLNFNRLEADIDPRNTASAKTLERLGFQKEGFLPERWIVDGEITDTWLYGLLARHWQGREA